MGICILAKFGTDWSIFGQYLQMLESKHSQIWQIFLFKGRQLSSSPISSIIELIWTLVVIYILTKFGDDWLIFVDAG